MGLFDGIKNRFGSATSDFAPKVPVFTPATLSQPVSAPLQTSTTLSAPTIPFINTTAPRKKVAIMGGGIGGLTAAKELMEKGFDVTIFEASARLGGHIYTQQNVGSDPNNPQYFERGAELIDATNKTMLRLCDEMTKHNPNFKVEVEDRRPDEKLEDIYFADGQRRSEAEVIAAYQPLADYIARDQAQLRNPDKSYTARAKQIDALSMDQYLAQAVADIRAQQGVEVPNWLCNILKQSYRSECGRDSQDMSALNLVDFISTDTKEGLDLFGDSDETYRIKGGNYRLIQALENYLSPKVNILKETPITGIQENSAGVTVQTAHGAQQFDYVVSALTLPALRNIQGADTLWKGHAPEKAQQIQGLVQNTQYTALSKIALETRGKPWGPNTHTGTVIDGDGHCQTSWVGNDKQAGDTPNSNGMVTFLIGGSANQQKPAEMLNTLKAQYAKALGKTVDEVFTGHVVYQDWNKTPCYVSPAPNQYTNLPVDEPLASVSGRVMAVGSYLPSMGEKSLMMGFMENSAKTACQAVEKIQAHAMGQQVASHVSTTALPAANHWQQTVSQPSNASLGPITNTGQGFTASYTQAQQAAANAPPQTSRAGP